MAREACFEGRGGWETLIFIKFEISVTLGLHVGQLRLIQIIKKWIYMDFSSRLSDAEFNAWSGKNAPIENDCGDSS